MAKLGVLLLLALISTHCEARAKPNNGNASKEHWTPQIVGGVPSPLGAFPHQVSFSRQDSHFCGGSIISSQFIVTAAHCCGGDSTTFSIRAGLNNVVHPESSFQDIKVAQVIIHPKYDDPTINNDICLLRLSSQLVLSNETRTAAIKLPQQGYTATGDAVVSGWGTTSEGGTLSDTLMNVTVPIVTDKECRDRYGQNAIADSMICAGEEGKDSCQGDSGGPMVDSEGYLIGIVSWGQGCAQKDYPGVYTEVSAYIQWINEILSQFQ